MHPIKKWRWTDGQAGTLTAPYLMVLHNTAIVREFDGVAVHVGYYEKNFLKVSPYLVGTLIKSAALDRQKIG